VIPHGMEVYVALDPIDLRWGFDRLAGVVTERLGRGARTTWAKRTTGPAIVSSRRRRDAHHRRVPAVNPRPVLYISAVSPLARQPATR